MIDTFVAVGYWIGGGLVILSVVGYIVFPMMIKVAFGDTGQEDSDPSETNN